MPSQGKEVWGMGKDARPLFTLKERRNDPMAGANESKANGADVASIAAAAMNCLLQNTSLCWEWSSLACR